MNATLIGLWHRLYSAQLSYQMGMVLLAGLLVWLCVEILRAALRLNAERVQNKFAIAKLRAQLEETRLRCHEAEQAQAGWNGVRKFSVARKVRQCEDVFAFYLKPHDGRTLPAFRPGQYLTFQLSLPGRDKPLVRCYSLSESSYEKDYYRVTIKREKSPPDRLDIPPGAASSYFAEEVKEGDILNVRAPTGHFCLDMTRNNPIVLLAGGVGVTPMLCMAKAIAASGSKREAWFFFGVRSSREHIHKEELEKLAEQHENIHLQVCYSKPDPDDMKGRDYQHEGRVCIELLKQLLPSSNFEYYLCGSGPFMKSLTDGLEAWGVPESDVHFEAFGPATVKKKAAAPTAQETAHLSRITISFARSNKTVPWSATAQNLLEFAAEQGVKIDSGCCAGSCGSCAVAIKSGAVTYIKQPSAQLEDGTCLACICRPKDNLVLDA